MNQPRRDGTASAGFPTLSRRGVLRTGAALLTAASAGHAVSVTRALAAPSARQAATTLSPGQIAFVLSHEQFTVPELVELAVAAEAEGFDGVWASDHLQPWQANQGHSGLAWLTLAALGQRTRHLHMGTGVTCPSLRYNPAVVAEAFATLGLLYPGRVFLGVGSGEALNEAAATGTWPKWQERSDRLVEATQLIRALWSGQPVDHRGRYYHVTAQLHDVPSVPVPIFMAGNGPRALRRCGEHGDGLITDPETWHEHRAQFEAGVSAAGKTAASPILAEQFVVVGGPREAEAAARLWRFIPRAWKPYYDIPDPREIERRANAEVPLEEVSRRWPVSTDPDVHAHALVKLFGSGVTQVYVHSAEPDQLSVIRFYGRQVLPRVRRRVAAAAPPPVR
jgi:F420-dependent hydroxymycolic acid dehydrogenase